MRTKVDRFNITCFPLDAKLEQNLCRLYHFHSRFGINIPTPRKDSRYTLHHNDVFVRDYLIRDVPRVHEFLQGRFDLILNVIFDEPLPISIWECSNV